MIKSSSTQQSVLVHTATGNTFADLPAHFFTRVPTTPLHSARLLHVNQPLALELGLSVNETQSPEFFAVVSGLQPMVGCKPLASVYSGHQFGVWAGQLGDGRAHYLGETTSPSGVFEWQLKGAGLTPYSRSADGRAVLRSSVREYLASEAMHGLGIPTTRALALVTSDDPVLRETIETAAIVTRLAPSFIRFGSFEHWASQSHTEALKQLADFVIERYYPECLGQDGLSNHGRLDHFGDLADQLASGGLGDQATKAVAGCRVSSADQKYNEFFKRVVQRTAKLIAQWQTVGFCHGVMNTDNMSILGLTIDYGPFGFMDGFDGRHICNHSDHSGRYAWYAQPSVAKWNLYCLANSLSHLVSATEGLSDALQTFDTVFTQNMHARMMAKLGLEGEVEGDDALIDDLFKLMHENKADFTLCFRELAFISNVKNESNSIVDSHVNANQSTYDSTNHLVSADDALNMGWLPHEPLSKRPFYHLFADVAATQAWANRYLKRVDMMYFGQDAKNQQLGEHDKQAKEAARVQRMLSVNPLYVLRNHLAQRAIEAAQKNDATELSNLLERLANPFVAKPGFELYAQPPSGLDQTISVSCSS